MKNNAIVLVVTILLPFYVICQNIKNIDEISPFSEGLAAVRKGNQWGFINEEGSLVIDFRKDVHWDKNADTSQSDVSGVRYPMFKEGRCLITKKVEDGIPLYGFMDTKGNTVIEPQFLNVYPFNDGYTTAVLFDKTLKGENEFKLKIYDFKFFDVLLDTSGEIDEYFDRRYGIQMTKRRYELPDIGVKRLTDGLIAVHTKDQGWEIRQLTLEN
ncbi:MAG: WG repeat-containing protein [Maribacter sp.]